MFRCRQGVRTPDWRYRKRTVKDDMGLTKRAMPPGVEPRQHPYLNNRAENSHQPTRQRERRLGRFKSPSHAQRLLSAYGPIASHFRPRRHRLPAPEYRQQMARTIPNVAGDHTGTALAA